MKRVINRKVYNTETATLVAEFDNGLGYNDFNAVREKLYITKKGNWFLHAWGGAASEYAETNGQYAHDADHIIPFYPEDALDFLERVNDNDAIEKYFSSEIEEA